MDVSVLSRFFALLAFVAGAGALLLAAGSITRSGLLRRFRDDVAVLGLPLAWLVAAVCMGGSLYFSEVAHFEPCHLCWYQRMAMYPLVLVLGIALVRRDITVRRYAIPLAVLGGLVSVYHFQLERFPDQTSFCSIDVPCSLPPVEVFGFVTLAFMALCGFAAIVALLAVAPAHDDRPDGGARPARHDRPAGSDRPAGGDPAASPADKELVQ